MNNEVKDCPECGSEFIDTNSNWSLQISEIRCTDCGFKIQEPIPEEDLIIKWNKLKRKGDINE